MLPNNNMPFCPKGRSQQNKEYKSYSNQMKEYNINLTHNIKQYKLQKDFNNKFFAAYTKFSPYHRSIVNNNFNCEQQFANLFSEYQKKEYQLPNNILKSNIFKRDPMLLVTQGELTDYYFRDINKTSLINEYLQDKSILTMHRLERISFNKLKEYGEDVSNGEIEYKALQRKLLKAQGIKESPDTREILKLNNEIKQSRSEIAFLNKLVNNEDMYDCINKEFTKSMFYSPKVSNHLKSYSLNKEDYKNRKIMTTQKTFENSKDKDINNNSNDKGKSKKKMNPVGHITLSTSFFSFGKRTTNQLNKNYNSSVSPNDISDINKNCNNKEKDVLKTTMLRKVSTTNEDLFTNRNSKKTNSQKVLSDEEIKSQEINHLYNKVKRVNILNPHTYSDDIINKLSFHFKKQSLSPVNIKGAAIGSFALLKESSLKRSKEVDLIKKMHQSKISIRTAKRLDKLQEVNANLSISMEKIAKHVIGSQV